MTSIAELGIKINSQDVDEASKKLDNLAKSGDKAESSLSGIKEPVAELKKELSSLAKQSSNILDHKSIKSFDKTISSVRSSTTDAAKGMRELTEASNTFRETEEQATSRINNMVAATIARKQASLEAAEAMRESARASKEEIDGWQDRVKAQNQSMQASKELMSTTEDLGKNQKTLTQETAKSQREFDNLLKKIDPTQAALKKLDAQVEQLGKHFDSGKLSQEQYSKGLAKLDAEYTKLEAGTSRFSETTKSTRRNVLQLLNALRSGNWKVATNNIAELGISSNASAASLLRIAAPIGLVVTAIGTLGYAFVRAERENAEFNKAIYLTGNYAGISLNNLNRLAESIRGVGGDQRKVVTALAEATKTGKFTENQLKAVATAALKMNAAFDIPISETISKFKELGESPSKSILQLNEQYNFLTSAVYDQIRALEQQGDKTSATNLAIEEFSRAQQEAAQKAISNAGYLERSWRAVTGAINDAVAALVSFGKVNDNTHIANISQQRYDAELKINELLEKQQKLRDKLEKDPDNKYLKGFLANNEEKLNIQRALFSSAEDSIKLFNAGGGSSSSDNKAQLEKEKLNIKAYYDGLVDSVKTNSQKFEQQKNELDKKLLRLFELSPDDSRLKGITNNNGILSGSSYDKLVESLQKKYKDSSTKSGAKGSTASDGMLQSLRQQEALLRQQLNTTDKLTSAQSTLAKFEQQIADLKEKKSLTAAQKVLLANESQIKAQLSVNAGIEEEIKLRKEAQAQQQWASALSDELAAKQKDANLNIATTWMGGRQAQELKELVQIQGRYAQQRKSLADGQGRENALSQKTYQDRLQLLEDAEAKEIEITKNTQQAKKEAEESWLHGANASYQNYLEEARNVSKQTESLFNNAFSSMEDALVSFVRNGKLSFSDFANAILNDLARIGVRMASSSALQAVFGSALGGLFGNYAGASNDLNGFMNYSGLYAKGGAFSGGVQAFAKGDAFTNSIVSSPTAFQFAKGGIPNLGIMGEAGDEAIIPLTRTSNGDLGVRAIISQMGEMQQGTTSGNNIQVYVTIDGNGNTETTTNSTNQSGQDLGVLIDSAMRQWVVKQQRQGGLLNPNNRRNQ